ncbi:hypothetical protein G3I71_48850, partial [Streptomyces sp. SID12501]|nr:hypothetical protein [Streptomyces sp. SID12501]
DGGLAAAVQAHPTVTGVDRQSLSIYDRAGNVIFADDAVAGAGLARPYIPIRFGRAFYLDWPGTSSVSFTDLYLTAVEKQAPMAYVVVAHTNDTSGATGQVQVTVNGTAVGTPTSTTFGVATTTIGPFELPGAHMDTV